MKPQLKYVAAISGKHPVVDKKRNTTIFSGIFRIYIQKGCHASSRITQKNNQSVRKFTVRFGKYLTNLTKRRKFSGYFFSIKENR